MLISLRGCAAELRVVVVRICRVSHIAAIILSKFVFILYFDN